MIIWVYLYIVYMMMNLVATNVCHSGWTSSEHMFDTLLMPNIFHVMCHCRCTFGTRHSPHAHRIPSLTMPLPFPLRFVMEAIKWKIIFCESERIVDTLWENTKYSNICRHNQSHLSGLARLKVHKISITMARTNCFILMEIYVMAARSTQRIHNYLFPSDTIFEIESIYASAVIITSEWVSSDLECMNMIDTHVYPPPIPMLTIH